MITGRNKVKFLCKNFEDGVADKRVENCSNNKQQQLRVLDVVFVRPNLDANFATGDQVGNLSKANDISNIGIVLESPGGEYFKTVVVWKTGQISVE